MNKNLIRNSVTILQGTIKINSYTQVSSGF